MTVTGASASSAVPRLLSVRAISEATTLPLSTIYDAIARGEMPCVRIGRSKRIREDDLLRWIESRRERAS